MRRRATLVRLLLGQGLRLLGIGAAIGLAGALAGTRYIEAQLFGVSATDPLTFVGGGVVLAVRGLRAPANPALRAMRIDPIEALPRAEATAVPHPGPAPAVTRFDAAATPDTGCR